MSDEQKVMVVEFDEGTENQPFSGKDRIFRAAFAYRDAAESVFEGWIAEGFFNENDDEQMLRDYNWEHIIDLTEGEEGKGQSIWRNLDKEMVGYTADVLGIDIEHPKHSLLFLVD